MIPLSIIQKNVHGSSETMMKVIEEAGYLTEILALQEPFDPAGKTKEYLRHYNVFFGCDDHAKARAMIATKVNLRASAITKYGNEDCACVKVELPIKSDEGKKLVTDVYFVSFNWRATANSMDQSKSRIAHLKRIVDKLGDKILFVNLDIPGFLSREDLRQVTKDKREALFESIRQRNRCERIVYDDDDDDDDDDNGDDDNDCSALTLLVDKCQPLMRCSTNVMKVYATCAPLRYLHFNINVA